MAPAPASYQAQSHPQFADSDYEHGRGAARRSAEGNRKKSWLGNFFD